MDDKALREKKEFLNVLKDLISMQTNERLKNLIQTI